VFARPRSRDYIVTMRAAPVLAAATVTLLFTGCRGDSHPDVEVSLAEWSIGVSPEVVKAGRVRFTASNLGSRPHEFVLLKSDLSPDLLPMQHGRVALEQMNVAAKSDPFAAKEKLEVSLDISPGKYLLICAMRETPPGGLLLSHYQEGMVGSLLIEP
jgi:uncharacterized cupredoxin-like copper-binding protein